MVRFEMREVFDPAVRQRFLIEANKFLKLLTYEKKLEIISEKKDPDMATKLNDDDYCRAYFFKNDWQLIRKTLGIKFKKYKVTETVKTIQVNGKPKHIITFENEALT